MLGVPGLLLERAVPGRASPDTPLTGPGKGLRIWEGTQQIPGSAGREVGVRVGLLFVVSLGLWVLDVQGVYIVFMCIGAAMLYGVLHDQVTARVCVEYFTVGHPPIFGTEDPTLLGLGWGILATWWVGLLLGIGLACAARFGSWPRREAQALLRRIIGLLLIMAAGALLAGIVGGVLAQAGAVFLVAPLAQAVPADRHAAFIAVLWAHAASYLVGFVGGLVVILWVWISRSREEAEASPNPHYT